jgi:DNA-binding beta-propeller fold protein YncE
LFDVNGHSLQDADKRWATEYDASSFMVGITKDVARVSSVGDGDLSTSRWRTESPSQALKIRVFGESDEEVQQRLDAWRNTFNQEDLVIGRTIAGVRRVVSARLESISELVGPVEPETGASMLATFRVTGAYWRAETSDEITLSTGTHTLTDLLDSTAPIADCKLLIAGASTVLSAFSIEDVNSDTGIAWSLPALAVGTYLSQFGSYGTGNGQTTNAQGIARDSSGTFYVVDYGTRRVQKFNSSGVYQSQFGTVGSGNGQFNNPVNIAIDSSGNIWVVDGVNKRVQKFNSSGVYQSQFGSSGSGNGQFNSPSGIAIDSSGNIWVVDSGNNRVQKFNSSGVYQSQFGTVGSGNGQFNIPGGIAIDSSGNIFVTDFSNNRVQKFNSSGIYQAKFGSAGTGDGQFTQVRGIVLDTSGNIFAVDGSTAARVQKFDIDGLFDGIGSGSYLLIDLVTRSAQVVASNDFDAVGDAVGGLTTVPWAGDKLRLTPRPSDADILVRELSVTMTQTGGGAAKIRARKAYL